MKIVVIGADGQLGTDLGKVIPKTEMVPLTIKDIDITDPKKVETVISGLKPDIIINTAAYHRVDDCEANDLEAYRVNAHGARNLAIAAREIGAAIVHISTDYVFSGERSEPYSESDLPNPKTAYGISKLAGELFVGYLNPRHYIVRTCGLYGVAGCLGKGGGNFVENMLKRVKDGQVPRVVIDEFVGPTYTHDLAAKLYELARSDKYGLYHITNSGQCSWWEFASEIFKILKMDVKVEKTTAAEFKAKAHRPKYSVLGNQNLKKAGLAPMRPWKEALTDYLTERGHLSK
ncbi:MAG TPA: dTDP-4-dehydrorhamnose reductase [Candidatus Omnitrophota bacterium]|nr:dTDP-4-dehydrorhamnose reductase [Candidatus Omnitrophota bacterium]